MAQKNGNATRTIFGIALAIILFGSGYKLGKLNAPTISSNSIGTSLQKDAGDKVYFDTNLFNEVRSKLREKYVDQTKIDEKKEFYGSLKGFVASLGDPYTFFLSPDENKQSKDDLGGRFEGIGAQLGLQSNQIVIIAPLKDSPAQKAGIRAGDFVIKVDDKPTRDWSLVEAVNKIRGPKGTNVKLTLMRAPSDKEFDITIERDSIQVASVETTFNSAVSCKSSCPQVAVLKINQFNETTNDEWDSAVDEIAKRYENGQIKGLVLDLRDNPGGFLDSAVYTGSEFVPANTLIVKQASKVNGDREYKSTRDGRLQKIPVVGLINKGSASASEILAGSLRDNRNIKLVGEKSFGKGSVQEALDLKDGAGLHVTIAKWLLPKGDWINGTGITPQIKIENKLDTANTLTAATDTQLQKAIETVLQ